MYLNVVRIKQEDSGRYGTGIVIADDTIVTAGHVVSNDSAIVVEYQTQNFYGCIHLQNEFITLIKTYDQKFAELYNSQPEKLLFTNQEIMSEEQKWEIQGYYSSYLYEHTMKGSGLYPSSTAKISCDYEVGEIVVGPLQDYHGMSGAPVICNNRAIGIVQMQETDPSGKLGIGFSSISSFISDIQSDSIGQSKYLSDLFVSGNKISVFEVEKNKNSAKYIPEIFVEERKYKDNLRYFCDPVLFIKKIIDDLQSLDFASVNQYLEGKELSFDCYKEINQTNFHDVVSALIERVRGAIRRMEREENDSRNTASVALEEVFRHRSAFNSALKSNLKNICEDLEYLEKRVVVVTRNAGQGKTNFLCDFTENFLVKKRIPTFYFNASGFID